MFTDCYVVAVRQGHPLTARKVVRVEDLLDFDWVVPNQGAPRRLAFDQLFVPTGRLPKTSIESHSLATIRATLVDSDRMAILTRSELAAEERMGLLTSIDIGPIRPSPVIGVTTRADWLPTSRQQAFLDLLRLAGARHAAQIAESWPAQPALAVGDA